MDPVHAAPAPAAQLAVFEAANRSDPAGVPRSRDEGEAVAVGVGEFHHDIGRALDVGAGVDFLPAPGAGDDRPAVREFPVFQRIDHVAPNALVVARCNTALGLAPGEIDPDAGLGVHVLGEGDRALPVVAPKARGALDARSGRSQAPEDPLGDPRWQRAQGQIARAARQRVSTRGRAHEQPGFDEVAAEVNHLACRSAGSVVRDDDAEGIPAEGGAQLAAGAVECGVDLRHCVASCGARVRLVAR